MEPLQTLAFNIRGRQCQHLQINQTDSSLPATKASIATVGLPYLLLVAVASAVIVSVALFTNRHRLESIINKRIKRRFKDRDEKRLRK